MNLFRMLCIGIIIAPALLCQSLIPVISSQFWERLNIQIYSFLVRDPLPDHQSQVALIEVDEETIAQLGWPIPRTKYVDLLGRLEAMGRPWILSLLQFQDLSDVGEFNMADPDLELAMTIESYGRYVGSSLVFREQSEILSDQQEDVLAKQLLSLEGPVEFLPNLNVQLRESTPFLLAERAFGFGAFFFAQQKVFCTDLYIDSITPGELVIPSSLFWAWHYSTDRSMVLENGIKVPGSSQTAAVAPKHCLKATALNTADYHERYGIKIYSLLSILAGEPIDLTGKLVVLSSSDMTLHLGPGNGHQDIIKAPTHLLFSRFLDGLLEGETVRKMNRNSKEAANILWYFAGLLLILLTVSGLRFLVATMVFVNFGLLAVAYYWVVVQNIFWIPSQGLVYGIIELTSWGVGILWYRSAALLGVARIREDLRRRLSQCISTEELEKVVTNVLENELAAKDLQFQLDASIQSLKQEIERLRQSEDKGSLLHSGPSSTPVNLPRPLWQIDHHGPKLFPLMRHHTLKALLQFKRDQRVIHQMSFEVQTTRSKLPLTRSSILTLALEMSLHLHRVELMLDQMLSDLAAVKLQQQLEMGQAVQKLFLPKGKSGQAGNCSYHIVFEPYGPMSGDWFQIFYQAQLDTLLIAIGDVVGKGPSAALNTAVIAAIWDQFTRTSRDQLAIDLLMGNLNTVIFSLFEGKQNTTLSLALVCGNSYTLIRAGSPPWFHGTADGMKRLPVKTSNPVGMLSECAIRAYSGTFSPGETLLTFSDGLMEGHDATQAFVNGYRFDPRPLSNFSSIEKHARRVGKDAALPDDLTMLMLQYSPN